MILQKIKFFVEYNLIMHLNFCMNSVSMNSQKFLRKSTEKAVFFRMQTTSLSGCQFWQQFTKTNCMLNFIIFTKNELFSNSLINSENKVKIFDFNFTKKKKKLSACNIDQADKILINAMKIIVVE